MRRLTVFNSVSLDGVMQAPGRADEDRRDGFSDGGWAAPYNDEVMARTAAEGMADPGPLLLGRRTYEDFFSFAVAELKRQPGQGLTVLGSGELVQALRRRELIDEYLLLIHPLVLGSGRRLFPDGGPAARLRLVDAKPTTTGVIIATYRPEGR
jgi:dihydrofolate reductase